MDYGRLNVKDAGESFWSVLCPEVVEFAGADAQDSCILVRARFTIVSIEVHGDLLLIFDSSSRAHLWTALDRLVHGGTPRRHSA